MKRLKKGDRAHSRYKRKSNHKEEFESHPSNDAIASNKAQDGCKEVSMQRNEANFSQAGEVSTGDELDALLERLSQLEPPASVIEQIFISIRHGPLSLRNELEEPEQKDELDISKDRLPPR